MKEFDFEQELLALQDKLSIYAHSLFSDREEAEDLLQETLLRAIENRHKYNDSNFKGWLYTIMHNTYLNICQAKSYRYTLSLSEEKTTDKIDHEDRLLINNEYDLKEIQKIINQLPEHFRIVLTMRLAGFKYQEIADKLGISINLVKTRIFYAKKKLKKQLYDFMDDMT